MTEFFTSFKNPLVVCCGDTPSALPQQVTDVVDSLFIVCLCAAYSNAAAQLTHRERKMGFG